MSRPKISCLVACPGILLLVLFAARVLAFAKYRDWPTTATYVYGPTLNAGEVANGSIEERRLEAASPFLLGKALREYPISNRVSVIWRSTYEALAMSPVTTELNYDRLEKKLCVRGYGLGGGHGTCYSNVTDDKIFKIVDNAGYFGEASLRDLEKYNCTSEDY